MKKYLTNNSDETKKIAKELASSLRSGEAVLLFGDLGAGKTTFTQGISEAMGIKDKILSPTFVLLRSHELDFNGIKILNHIDLYRLENRSEIEALALDELAQDDSIIVIEWAEKLMNKSFRKGYKVYLKHLGNERREILIENI